MKKFSFTLQKVLDLREFQENQAKTQLAAAISQADLLRSQLGSVAQKRSQTNLSRREIVDPNQMIAVEHYVLWLDNEKERLLNELAQAELVIEEKRKDFAEAMKNRKVLDNLKEKQFAQYKKDFYKAEENAADDIASHSYYEDEEQ